MSILLSNGTLRTAGSRLMTYGGSLLPWRCELILCINVVFPEPSRMALALYPDSARIRVLLTSHSDADNSYWLSHIRLYASADL